MTTTFDGEPLHNLVTYAFREREGAPTRYGDRDIAEALADLDAKGLLLGNARMAAARIIAEIAIRIDEYGSATSLLTQIRAHALIATRKPKEGNDE